MKPIRLRLPLFVLCLLAVASLLLAHDGPHHPGLRPDGPDDGSPASEQLPTGSDAAEKAEKKGADKKGDAKGGDKKDEKKWDVDNPPGPSSNVTIDVDEGTWMSVDVSPDGKEIAFDLLGDLYTIPIAGGTAKALTHDIAWQEQPTYSPDGKRIAFTSDQGGGDNIWTIDRTGKDPKQISKETFRLLNSPTWTPDGNYLAGRKHFTTTRSAGSGEIWMYHRGGGSGGIALTKRPTTKFQKDIGEPAFSPDGRYLYYSRDATVGTTFEYN
jgi:tricorn protease-like protein